MSAKNISRREMFRVGAAAGALGAPGGTAAPSAATSIADNVYTRIGVRPFINCTATYTINGGALVLPEVRAAMEEASRYSVNIDELMEKVGARLAKLLGCEAAIVTAGAAAALTHATAACVAGADPEKMRQLPDTTGLKNEVVVARQSRHEYDQAIRAVGVKMVEVDTREEFHAALRNRTAMISVLGKAEAAGKIRLEEMVAAGRKAGVPVLVDAAAEAPSRPDPYLSRGADLVAYSGGKILRGPQCAGLLIGRQDLIEAAWWNSAPHHALGRGMKVGKEEIMGLLAAVEAWSARRDRQAEFRQWESWYAHIGETLTRLSGIRTEVRPPEGDSPYPILRVSWDPEKFALNGPELHRRLLEGEPRIMSHAREGEHSFRIRAVSMRPGDEKRVAARLYDIFRQAAGTGAVPALAAPAHSVAGRWDVDLQFVSGSVRHTLLLQHDGHRVWGTHEARLVKGEITGTVSGVEVRLRSALRYEGDTLSYVFTGRLAGDTMEGELRPDEYGKARWRARRRA